MDMTNIDEFPGEISWHSLVVGGRPFIHKFIANETNLSYRLLVSDYRSIWRETLDLEGIVHRNSELNPNIEAPAGRLLTEICHLFDGGADLSSASGTDWRLSKEHCNEEMLSLTACSSLANIQFEWNFRLNFVDKAEFYEHLTSPLLLMITELFRRQRGLIDVIADKDSLIADYRADGAKLLRKPKYEHPFNYTSFVSEIEKSSKCGSKQPIPETAAFDSQMQTLYIQVVQARNQERRAQRVSMPHTDDPVEHQTSSREENLDSTKKVDSGEKVISEKEKEKLRRQLLQEKLEEERSRKESSKNTKKLKL